ncbi:MAG: ATP-binding protein [Deltaproteobacteria bacterium]|nr:ATP-binding protein [Deltaproteobacteria bacterium]
MESISRNIEKQIEKDLQHKFVFLSGPRQVGKTTLAKRVLQKKRGVYLLYDDDDDRRTIIKKEYVTKKWVCLDEFHKFQRWKNHIKGVYDKYHEDLHLILTGSARLDIFQKSGDSLFGRYYLFHLHPLTCGELKQSAKEHLRWSNARNHLLIREDLRELTQVKLITLVEQLMLLLPERIGSLFSYRSLSEDLKVGTATIQNWMEIFKKLFIVYSISPYTKKINRSLQKQPKYYLYDWSQIPDEGHQFENLVASHLWKACQLWTDLGEANMELHFIRDRMGREVDFIILKDRKPWFLVETKLAETSIDKNLKYFCNRLNVPGLQVIKRKNFIKEQGAMTVISADRWLANLP